MEVLDRKTTSKLGQSGLVLRVTAADAQAGAGRVSVRVDYSAFAHVGGADWASRLRLVRLPNCATSTPDASACAPAPVAGTWNDARAGQVVANIDVPAVADAPATPPNTTPPTTAPTPNASGQGAGGGKTPQVKASTSTPRTSPRPGHTPSTEPKRQPSTSPSAPPAQAPKASSAPSSSGGALLALTAGASGPQGDFSATPLSASATWQVSNQSGDFTWSYPIRLPATQAGPTPQIGLSYSSGSVDGRTSATNNQPSWIGEGFDYWPGYIERKYKPCSDDGEKGTPAPGDQCWGGENATLSLNGSGAELVRDDKTGQWRPKNDDGMKIEHLTGAPNTDNDGEYWRVTTDDGTQYYFGKSKWNSTAADTNSAWTVPVAGNNDNEPCHASTFAGSFCDQAWRWNLDYVVDPRGNAMAYYYAKETNYYAKNKATDTGTAYIRGGYLVRADWGLTTSDISPANSPYRVNFDVKERCLTDGTFNCDDDTKFVTANAAHWPDVPVDQSCLKGKPCKDHNSPTFWTRKRLATITTKVWNGTAYNTVDTYDLAQSYPGASKGVDAALWLQSIAHTGHLGGTDTPMPKVIFHGDTLPNRVDGLNDGLPNYARYRIIAIDNESGGTTNVVYSPTECATGQTLTPETNDKRCFPIRIPRPGATDPNDLITDWMHKYVVTQVSQDDRVGGSPATVTSYQYLDKPAWHYPDNDALTAPKYKTWSDYRGYSKVRVLQGSAGPDQTRTDYLYYRGMDGDRADPKDATKTKPVTITDSEGTDSKDDPALQGFLREQITYNGVNGPELGGSINTAWVHGPTATQGALKANIVNTAKVRSRTALVGQPGGYRRTELIKEYNDDGTVRTQWDRGDLGATIGTDDDRCTHYTYGSVPAKGIDGLVQRQWTDSIPCRDGDGTGDPVAPKYPDQSVSDMVTSYNDFGEATKVEEAKSYSGGTPQYVTVKTNGYDSYGRITSSTDALGHKTTTGYTPSTGAIINSITVTNVKGHTTSQTLNALGSAVSTTDTNGNATTFAYDGLGRVTKVWGPGRTTAQTPNAEFAYQITGTAPTVVTSKSLLPYGGQKSSYQIYDGLLRPRQAQGPVSGSGRILADTFYDSAGRAWKSSSPYYDKDHASSGVLAAPADDNQVPSQTVTTFDGAGRAIKDTLYSFASEKWSTSTQYLGDRTIVNPPQGGRATTTLVDARGKTTELWQDNGDGFDKTRYEYTPAGQLAKVLDPEGREHSYSYDLRGNKISQTDPDSGTTSMTYDDGGELKTITGSRPAPSGGKQTIGIDYDELGRKTGLFDQSATGRPQLAGWEYDTLAKGQMTRSVRYSGGQQYVNQVTGYDKAGRPTGNTITIPTTEGNLGKSYTSSITYNLDGSVDTQTMPAAGGLAAETVSYSYNGLGQLTSVDGTIGGKLTTYAYGASYTEFGELNQLQLGTSTAKSTWVTNYYDPATRRLNEVRTDRTGTSQADDVHYSYDPSGNVTKIASTPQGQTADIQCFHQDSRRRLDEAWTPTTDDCSTRPTTDNASTLLGGAAPYWQSYGYSAGGNRTGETDHDLTGDTGKDVRRTFNYDENGTHQPNTLTSALTETGDSKSRNTYTYDQAGNTVERVINGDTQKLQWDPEGRLDKFTTNDGKDSTYLYDAEGDLLLRRQPGATTLYLDGQELAMDATGKVTATRYYAHGDRVIAVRTENPTKPVTVLLADPAGTATTAIDPVTQEVTRRRYTPFGTERLPAGQTQPTAWPDQKGFVGGTNDPQTGLVHLGAREYDTSTGRFISGDPLFDQGDPQSMNSYAYADNNPSTNSDPTGTRCWPGEQGECHNGDGVNRQPNAHGPGYTVRDDDGNVIARSGNSNGGGWAAGHPTGPTREQLLEQKAKEMRARVAAAQGRLKNALLGIVKIAADELGITAGIDCVTKGDFGACGETVLNIAMSFAGGIAAKILSKYGAPWKWAKGARLAKRLWKLAGEAVTAIKDFIKAGKEARTAERALEAERRIAKVAKSCPINSFPGNAKVLLANGRIKNISQVQPGDKVLAANVKTGKTGTSQVTGTISGTRYVKLIKVSFFDSKALRGSTVTATEHHLFWDREAQQWLRADELSPGRKLLDSDGNEVRVTSVDEVPGHPRVHDITVADTHSFYVSAGGVFVLAHNCGDHVDTRAGLDFTDAERQKVYDANAGDDGGFTCDYCGRSVFRRPSRVNGVAQKGLPDDAQIDHIIPKTTGGCGAAHNGCVACRLCNRSKSNKPLEDWDDELREFLADD
ncbi:RHS repeat-associated core domain-containing protein [Actinomadura rupiterrae]|uniref:RHS repeat-associated core domain-containing protein n=1 Tax=Actinomadura rupiterrae TaxID=559627 RepID=UPI0020A28AC6|nr:RHS repeat-associated core domain-containing protein [Actinomadura rupiterrae]MCP2337364.1 RHS repeat-associated protein [Actinomadura rupiterrae]